MFEKYAIEYYKSDDYLSNFSYDTINECIMHAEAKLEKLNPYRRFHDDYIVGFHIYIANDVLSCKVELSSHIVKNKTSTIIFHQVTSLNIQGELISTSAIYPPSQGSITFAQVLDVWFDYQSSFECCFLLDNERYFILKSKDIQFIV